MATPAYGSPEYWAQQQQAKGGAQAASQAALTAQQNDPAYQAANAARMANQHQIDQDFYAKHGGQGQLGANQGLSVVAGAGGPSTTVTNNTAPLTGASPTGGGVTPPAGTQPPPPANGVGTGTNAPQQAYYGNRQPPHLSMTAGQPAGTMAQPQARSMAVSAQPQAQQGAYPTTAMGSAQAPGAWDSGKTSPKGGSPNSYTPPSFTTPKGGSTPGNTASGMQLAPSDNGSYRGSNPQGKGGKGGQQGAVGPSTPY